MYYPFFVAYMLVGFAISLLVFFWALRNGQFSNQERARVLPLVEEPLDRPGKVSKLSRLEALVLGGLACAGLLTSAAVLLFALIRVQ